jgi:hypothetical protein
LFTFLSELVGFHTVQNASPYEKGIDNSSTDKYPWAAPGERISWLKYNTVNNTLKDNLYVAYNADECKGAVSRE